MNLITAWLLFPAALLAVMLGCGLLVRGLTAVAIPGALVPGVGLAVLISVGSLTTATDATAELTTPVIVALALAGYAAAWPFDWRRAARAAIVPGVAGLAVFLVYGAPILLSGDATVAGYIKLDDTGTWLALTDRVMEHGRSIDGLAPSTYQATLEANLGDGYPIGAFLPLGVGSQLIATDPAWTVQPLMALMAALLAASLSVIARPVVESGPLRAAIAFIAAQPALLLGYVLWGGIKEVEAAALIALCAALAALALERRKAAASIIPLALAAAALLSVLSPGGAVWLAPILAAPLVILWRLSPAAARTAAAVLAGICLLVLLPLIGGGELLPPTSSPLTSATAQGNLIEPLSGWQVFGIWPVGDFRLHPSEGLITAIAIAVAAAMGVWGMVLAARSRAAGALLYVAGAGLGCIVLTAIGSPWVDGKALATASPALTFAAALGIAGLFARGHRLEAGLAAVIVAGGVLVSNALAYRDVNLAPAERFAELERIGEDIAGEGPTLMTEYDPFAARHFLREGDAEGVSELRTRAIPLRNGELVVKGGSADTDELDLGALLEYRTLVLRRSPAQSRPPAPYQLVESGESFDVWQQPASPTDAVTEHLPLGNDVDPAGVPSCAEVTALASRAAPGQSLAAVSREPVSVLQLDRTDHPSDWMAPVESHLYPGSEGAARGVLAIPAGAPEVEVWLGGSVRARMDATLGGRKIGGVRHLLNHAGGFVLLGEADGAGGSAEVELDYSGSDLHPGSGGTPYPIGPLIVAPSDEPREVSLFSPDQAAELCGRRWDWIELVG